MPSLPHILSWNNTNLNNYLYIRMSEPANNVVARYRRKVALIENEALNKDDFKTISPIDYNDSPLRL